METYTILVLLAATFTSTLAAVAMGPAALNEDCPGQCWDAGNSKCVPVGESYIPSTGGCSRAYCYSQWNGLFVEYLTCGLVAVPPGCSIVEDKTLTYPDCCTTMNCDSSHSLEDDIEYQEFTNWIEQVYPDDSLLKFDP